MASEKDPPDSPNVVFLRGTTLNDVPVGRILDGARDLEHVLVIGRDAQGDLQAASSSGDVGYVFELLEEFKYSLISGVYGPRVRR
jgi:hypothetical protein